MREQNLNSFKSYKDKGLRTVFGLVGAFAIFSIGALTTLENDVKAELTDNSYKAVENVEWYPGKLNADGLSQEMPTIHGGDSHSRFKALCEAYGLDASLIRELENRYNIREGILLAILIAETSGGNNGNYVEDGCYNLGNVGNNDRGDRVCFEGKEESIEQVAITLNNRYLGNVLTLGCLSNAGSCIRYDDNGKRYATSNGNWERNVLNVLNTIYRDELGEIEPSKFSIRRDFTSLQ